MSGKVLLIIWFVYTFFIVHHYNAGQTFASNAVKTNLADVLNAHLGHSQWAKITDVQVKSNADISNACVSSFSGRDLFVRRGLYSRVGNTLVGVDDAYAKYYMVVNLVGCVYANATYAFTALIKNILSVSGNERRLSKNRAYMKCRRTRDKELSVREQMPGGVRRTAANNSDSSAEDGRRVYRHASDEQRKTRKSMHNVTAEFDVNDSLYNEIAWTVFDFAYKQLLDGRHMFEYMHDALLYLFRLTLREQHGAIHPGIRPVQQILQLVEGYKDIAVHLKRLFPNYTGGGLDAENRTNGATFTKKLYKSVNTRNQFFLDPFVRDRCKLPAKKNGQTIKKMINTFLIRFPEKRKTDIVYQFGIEIQQLAREVVNSYYFDLGFVYTE